MMGKDAFEKLKEQIQQQENVRQNLNQQLSEIKQQRKDLNEKIEINESQLQNVIKIYFL